MTNSLQLDNDVSQTSVSFAVSPSQKPILIQAVFSALLVKTLISSWESRIVNIQGGNASDSDPDHEALHSKLMN